MMRWLVSTCLRQPVLILALACALMVIGYRSLGTMPMDVFPEFAPPLVEIQTEAPGLSAEEVESLVSVPLENALNGTSWLETIRSKSVQGLSSVVLIFEEGCDLMRARQLVQERLAIEAPHLPAVARAPVILSPLSSTSRVLKIGVWSPVASAESHVAGAEVELARVEGRFRRGAGSEQEVEEAKAHLELTQKKLAEARAAYERLDMMDLTELARWTIRPRLMAVPGVANVAIWGQRDRQFQVLVDPERLRASGVSLDAVLHAASDAAVVSTGGFVDTPNQRLAVRHLSPIREADDLALTVVAVRDGTPIRLGDVADVVEGFPPPIGDGVINGGPGLLLIVEKQPWGNTLDVTRKVEEALEALKPGLHDVEIDHTIFRPATFIERALENLGRAMIWGCVLVIVILVAFLFDWRTALISCTAIPLSLMSAAVILRMAGATMNTMILAGLVIALGEVVDDAIIDVENIVRRLRLNRQAAIPRTPFRVVLDASLEVRSAVVFASLIVMLVFLPVFFLEGLAGSFFRPLAASYVLAIFSSLVVALTVTPAMSMLLLPGAVDRRKESPLTAALKVPYRFVLPAFVRHPSVAVVCLLLALVVPAAAIPMLGEQFLPKFQETDFLMHWVEKPSTGLDAMVRISQRAGRELLEIEGVRNFGAHIGRAEVADEVVGPDFTELWISLDEDVDYKSTVAKVQEVVDGYPGLYRDLLTYLSERIKEVLTGAHGSIVVRIYGPELDVLRETAHEVGRVVEEVPGVINLEIEHQVLVPQLEVRLRPEAAERFGLTPGQIRRTATTLIKGTKVGEVYEEQKIFDVAVWSRPEIRSDPMALRELLIETPTGARVPLGEVAEVNIVATPNSVKREGASRRIDVSCNVEGRDLGSVAREIEQRVRALSFERGYHPEFLGEYAAQIESRNRLLAVGALALVGIIVLLHTDFRSVRLVVLVLLGTPFALVGCVVGAWLGGGAISLGSLVGFVTVLGISTRNGIMLISHYRHLQEKEGMPFDITLVLRGAEERLAPILMTALTTGLALLPLILAGHRPGHEIEYPMAWVIVGGLVSSTLLNLLLMPGLYRAFGRPAATA
jgi:CzcA family heavy metal efflux pump